MNSAERIFWMVEPEYTKILSDAGKTAMDVCLMLASTQIQEQPTGPTAILKTGTSW